MRRYLVVAHRTLGGSHLLAHLERLRAEGPCRFTLLVPVEHPNHMWTEGEVTAAAGARLQDGLARLSAAGIVADGEVGDASPVYAVGAILRREGEDAFDEVIVSTLPETISRWVRMDVPRRIQREHPRLRLVHLVAEREPASS